MLEIGRLHILCVLINESVGIWPHFVCPADGDFFVMRSFCRVAGGGLGFRVYSHP